MKGGILAHSIKNPKNHLQQKIESKVLRFCEMKQKKNKHGKTIGGIVINLCIYP